MNFVSFIKKLLGFEEPTRKPRKKETAISQGTKREVEQEYREQIGSLKGENQALKRELENLREKEDELQQVKKDLNSLKAKRLQERDLRKKGLGDRRDADYISISNLMRSIHKDGVRIAVLSKDHRPLGYLCDFEPVMFGGELKWRVVVWDDDGNERVAMRGSDLFRMIHRPVHLVDVLDTGVIVLNRHADSMKPVPDEYLNQYGERKHLEEVVEEKNEEINKLMKKFNQAKKAESKERTKRQLEEVNRSGEKATNEMLSEQLLDYTSRVNHMMDKYNDVQGDLREESAARQQLETLKTSLEKVRGDLMGKLEEHGSKDEVEKARDEIEDTLQSLKQLMDSQEIVVQQDNQP